MPNLHVTEQSNIGSSPWTARDSFTAIQPFHFSYIYGSLFSILLSSSYKKKKNVSSTFTGQIHTLPQPSKDRRENSVHVNICALTLQEHTQIHMCPAKSVFFFWFWSDSLLCATCICLPVLHRSLSLVKTT